MVQDGGGEESIEMAIRIGIAVRRDEVKLNQQSKPGHPASL
jgi:hypothetical protein